jgi:recombination protein U
MVSVAMNAKLSMENCMKKSKGKWLENRVARANRRYMKAKLCFAYQNGVSAIVTNQGVKLMPSPVDFICLIDGLMIVHDCKETKQKVSFAFSLAKSHQLEFLRQVEANGGAGFLLVHAYELFKDEAYFLPITLIDETLATGKKSIKFRDIDHLLVPIDNYLQLLNTEDNK